MHVAQMLHFIHTTNVLAIFNTAFDSANFLHNLCNVIIRDVCLITVLRRQRPY